MTLPKTQHFVWASLLFVNTVVKYDQAYVNHCDIGDMRFAAVNRLINLNIYKRQSIVTNKMSINSWKNCVIQKIARFGLNLGISN